MSKVDVTADLDGPRYGVALRTRGHRWHADEPEPAGGKDAAPSPTEQLAGALASCTAITVQMYAERKGWQLSNVEVRVRFDDGERGIGAIDCQVRLEGELDDVQRTRLLEIAARCPVHRLLKSGASVSTTLGR